MITVSSSLRSLYICISHRNTSIRSLFRPYTPIFEAGAVFRHTQFTRPNERSLNNINVTLILDN